MKRFLLFAFFVSCQITGFWFSSMAQIYNGATITIQNNAELYFDGAATNTGAINNSGKLFLKGDFTNNGTALINDTVLIEGTSNPQNINGVSKFEYLELNKASGTAYVTSGTTSVTKQLRLKHGAMDAGSGNGNLVIASDVNGTGLIDDFSLGFSGTLAGNVRVQRYVAGNGGFHHIGSPVNAPFFSELSELGLTGTDLVAVTPLPDCNSNNLASGSNYGHLFEWHEDGPFNLLPLCFQEGWFVRSNPSDHLTNGRGYAAIVSNQASTIEISGVANTGTISYTGLISGGTGAGWQLVSNTYPSPITWSAPSGFNSFGHYWVDGGFYAGTYQQYSPGDLIGSMQGFFVNGSGNFTLTQSNRSLGTAPFHLDVVNNRLELIIEGNGFADKTVINFSDDGPTNQWDNQFDAHKLKSNSNQPTLFTLVDNEMTSINTLQFTGHPNTIPLGLLPGTAGTFTITAHDLNTFGVSTQIFLEDLRDGVIQNLFTDPVYTFTANPNDSENRFLLHFNLSGQTTGIDNAQNSNVEIYGYGSSVNILVNFPSPQNGIISIYDMLGQEIYTEHGSYMGKSEIKLNGISSGSYIIRAAFDKNTYTERVILEKQ